MSLADFYGIPESTAKKMLTDGTVSCSVVRHFEIYEAYKKYMATGRGIGKKRDDIYFELASEIGTSESTVKAIVYRLDKIS